MSDKVSATVIALREYTASLLAQARQAEVQSTARSDQKRDHAGPDTPLRDRVRALVLMIPGELLNQGVPIEWFRIRLRGKYRRHPTAGDVAQALRELGWTRKRSWSNGADGFRARWFPPCPE